MRIRSTKPEFWRSRRIAAVEWDVRFVLKGLESYVDDNGVGKDDIELIVGDLFSRDLIREPSRTLKRVSEALNTLSEAGLLHRYTHEGTDLLYVSWWEDIQKINRPSSGRLPRPDGTFEYGQSKIGAPAQSPQEPSRALSAGTGEQGNRGTGEQTPTRTAERPTPRPASNKADGASAGAERGGVDEDFAAWYAEYPRKKSKGQAVKAYRAARKKVDAQTLLDSLRQQLPAMNQRPADKRPYPASWLNGECWADEPDAAPENTGGSLHHLPHASEIQSPPPNMTEAEYDAWDAQQRANRRRNA